MTTTDSEVQEFLKAHPQLLVGRAAWVEANEAIKDDNTFIGVSKPFPNMQVYQTISAESNRAIMAAALLSDERAEAHYRKIARPQTRSCVCPEGNCSQWQLRCCVCAWVNDEPCKWDGKKCSE